MIKRITSPYRWDGGSAGLSAVTGRASLGLGALKPVAGGLDLQGNILFLHSDGSTAYQLSSTTLSIGFYDSGLITTANGTLTIRPNAAVDLLLQDTGGKVGIGTVPAAGIQLHVGGTVGTGNLYIEGDLHLKNSSGVQTKFISRNSGGGFGLMAPDGSEALRTVNGAVYCASNLRPMTDFGIDLGASTFRWHALFVDFIEEIGSIVPNPTAGMRIGTATTAKVGFWNAAPVVQQAHIADPSGGTVIDVEARVAIASLNALCATLGLTAAA